ncbi:cache domain-containing protein [Enterocloster citroniae]|uniref:cache domain-containing protein n=1 Tax=Enterocloster citroniae TaxID=358743 RepID=UPI0009F709BF|nr:cache domain-containing protein [Enterocloster citroniae]
MDKGTHAPTDFSRYNPGEMISFVVPLYVGNTTIGAVGMDIDFDAVKDMVDATRVYDTGYAFLTDDQANVKRNCRVQRTCGPDGQ